MLPRHLLESVLHSLAQASHNHNNNDDPTATNFQATGIAILLGKGGRLFQRSTYNPYHCAKYRDALPAFVAANMVINSSV